MEFATKRTLEVAIDFNNLIALPLDVSRADLPELNVCGFFISTYQVGCTMTLDDLMMLGYDTSVPVKIPIIRVGAFDFVNVPVSVGEKNIIGTNILKWLDFSISASDKTFSPDIISRIKPIVLKGINPAIKLAYDSLVKGSCYNENGNWHTWSQIDALYPDSWVLMNSGDDSLDYGGEVLSVSQADAPQNNDKGTFIYCNKSNTTQKSLSEFTDAFYCRGFIKAEQAFNLFIEELESKFQSPSVDRFYYNPFSREGRLYMTSKGATTTAGGGTGVLSQAEIDALFAQF